MVATQDRAVREIPLAEARPGDVGTVSCSSLAPDDAAMLRAMGLRDRSRIRLCRVGEPCIVELMGCSGCSCRIGLSRPLAQRVTMLSVGA